MLNDSTNNSTNNRRIARNTLLLYLRMLLMMGVMLYTSRVVLEALGVEDYGIYSVVGGVVAMFTMISGSLSSAISRFITFELGRGESQERVNIIFSTSLIIQLLIAAIIVILVESVGVWFLTNKMVIPLDRLTSAKWVMQFSLITLIINMISLPYSATIIAHERMSAFAYISIIQAAGQLIIAYYVGSSSADRLILYAALSSVVALVIRLIYGIYCRRRFEECRFRVKFDLPLFKEMFSFAGWDFFGTASVVARDQGGNILLNILGGGPVVNAARGISTQVGSAIVGFATNFMVALNPQITKSYAAGDYRYMMSLIFNGSRYSLYMLLIISLPIIVNTPYILAIWLGSVPEYAVSFVRLTLIFGMCDALARPAIAAILATGRIKKCQIIIGIIQLLNIPISYLLLREGYPPTSVFVVAIALVLLCLAVRIVMLQRLIGLSVRHFISEVLLNVSLVSLITSLVSVFSSRYIMTASLVGALTSSAICVITTLATIYFVGCSSSERSFINQRVKNIIK